MGVARYFGSGLPSKKAPLCASPPTLCIALVLGLWMTGKTKRPTLPAMDTWNARDDSALATIGEAIVVPGQETLVTHCSNAATDNRRVSLSRQWAPAEDNQLRSLIVAGERPAEIAVRLRRSVGAVYARAHRFRLSFKRVQQRQR
jgi:hypothetical protein